MEDRRLAGGEPGGAAARAAAPPGCVRVLVRWRGGDRAGTRNGGEEVLNHARRRARRRRGRPALVAARLRRSLAMWARCGRRAAQPRRDRLPLRGGLARQHARSGTPRRRSPACALRPCSAAPRGALPCHGRGRRLAGDRAGAPRARSGNAPVGARLRNRRRLRGRLDPRRDPRPPEPPRRAPRAPARACLDCCRRDGSRRRRGGGRGRCRLLASARVRRSRCRRSRRRGSGPADAGKRRRHDRRRSRRTRRDRTVAASRARCGRLLRRPADRVRPGVRRCVRRELRPRAATTRARARRP